MSYRRRKSPQLIAHKGDSGEYPENTVASVRSAIEVGADMVEVDVWASLDGVPVVVHGPRLEASTTGHGPVVTTPWAEVATLLAKDARGRVTRESVPRLEELWERHGTETSWNIDLKDDAAIAPVLHLIDRYDMRDRVVLSGSTHPRAARVLAVADAVGVLLDLTHVDKLIARTPVGERWLTGRYRRVLEHVHVLALNVPYRYVTPSLVASIHRLGGEVWTFTVDDQSEVDRLVAAGVDSITTNLPGVITIS